MTLEQAEAVLAIHDQADRLRAALLLGAQRAVSNLNTREPDLRTVAAAMEQTAKLVLRELEVAR